MRKVSGMQNFSKIFKNLQRGTFILRLFHCKFPQIDESESPYNLNEIYLFFVSWIIHTVIYS